MTTGDKELVRRVAPMGDGVPFVSGADARIVASPEDEPPPEETTPADRGENGTVEEPPDPSADALPPWAKIPKGFTFPRGTQPIFVLFKSKWTAAPFKHDRTAILWELTDLDELEAYKRAGGVQPRAVQELAKAMIRSIDGHVVDWSGDPGPGSIDAFWREIGAKCRDRLTQIYVQRHSMDAQERADFFTSCVVVRNVV